MPELVRLYVRHVIFGAALSAVFVALLLGFNIANLRHLILGSPVGYVALAMLLVFNALVFAGVQFGIAVMGMAERSGTDGGRRGRAGIAVPVAIPVRREDRPAPRMRPPG